MKAIPPAAFEELVADALDEVPPELMKLLDNVVVLVEDRNPEEPDLLGLYEGFALTERGWEYGGALPGRNMIYRQGPCDIRDRKRVVWGKSVDLGGRRII